MIGEAEEVGPHDFDCSIAGTKVSFDPGHQILHNIFYTS